MTVGTTAVSGIAGASPSAHDSVSLCDVSTVEDPIISIPSLLPEQQVCGIEALENDAYDLYAYSHGMQPGDPRLSSANGNDIAGIQEDVAGIVWALLQQIIQAHSTDTSLTTDQQGAYDWFQGVVTGFRELAANDAEAEYTKWNSSPCTYLPPNTSLFKFRGANDPACSGTLSTLFAGPSPPSFEEFVEMGQYDADQTLHLDDSLGGTASEELALKNIDDAQSTWSALLLGGVGEGLNFTGEFNALLSNYLGLVQPFRRLTVIRQARTNFQSMNTEEQDLQDLSAEDVAKAAGEEVSSDIEEGAETASTEAADAGFDTVTLVDAGTGALSGPFIIVGIAVAVLVQASLQIAQEIKLPDQLQNNINAADVPLETLLNSNSGAGYGTLLTDFEDQLALPGPTIGTPGHVVGTAPNDGSEFEVSLADSNQNIVYTDFQQTVKIATWPLGIDQGEYGAPQVNLAYYDGQSYQQVNPDEQAAGLSGYVPSGEIHYFDWEGNPRVALIDGTQFIDVSGPGTADLGGNDLGDMCDPGSGTDCQLTSFLDALGTGQKIDESFTTDVLTNGGLTEVKTTHASDGHVNVQPSDIRYRISLKPDTGTPAIVNIYNQFGDLANQNNPITTPGGGGLFAGDTVTFNDPETSQLGFSTTYKWEIETRCPYDPTHPIHMVRGLPVCYGSSDYDSLTLPSDETDLTTCDDLGNCTEDPAFHGDPVDVVTSQATTFSWPTSGTYHVRLITTDEYNHVNQVDQDVGVLGVSPSLTLTSTAGSDGVNVFGPVQNGQSMSITGCIVSVSSAYDNPQISVDWGDGTSVDAASGQDDSSPNISFVQDPSNCNGAGWSFTATHTYQLTSSTYQERETLNVTASDGEGETTSIARGVVIQFNAQPAFTSSGSATFIAGTSGNFTVTAPGNPTPTISIASGTLPSGLGFDDNHNGTAIITGDPSITEGGSYPLTLRASNGSGPNEGTVTQSFIFNVDTSPEITSSSVQRIAINAAADINIVAVGSPAPSVSISGDSIPGLTISDVPLGTSTGTSTAVIQGTPTVAGVYHLVVTATNPAGTTKESVTLTVGSLPAFSSSTTAGFVTNSEGSFTVVTTGTPPASLSISGSLPNGLSFHDNGNGTAEIYGTPTGQTSDDVMITATNSAGSTSQNLTVVASATGGPTVTVSGTNVTEQVLDPVSGLDQYTSSFIAGQAGPSVTITSSATSAPLSETGTLPTGVTFTDNGNGTATVTGTPAMDAGGYYFIQVTSTPTSGPVGLGFIQIEVYGPPVITSASTAIFAEGASGTFSITAQSIATPRFAIVSGTLPNGLTFDDPGLGTATISGTPTGPAGITTVTIQSESVEDLNNPVDTTLSIEVDATPLFSSSANVQFAEGIADSFTSTTTGGYPSPTLSVIGTLPPGVSFTDNGDGTGTFSGTPTDVTELSYPVILQASSTAGTTTQTMTINVGPLPTITSSTLATFMVGSSSATLEVTTASTSPVTLSVANLPTGFSFTDNGNGTGNISATPSSCSGGTYAVNLSATNSYGTVGQDLDLVVDEEPNYLGLYSVSCASPDPTNTSPTVTIGDNTGATLYVSGYPVPTLSVAGALPDGINFIDNGNGSGDFSGEATNGTGGTYPVTLTITNAVGTTTEALTLVVDQQAINTSDSQTTWIAGMPNSFTIQTAGYPNATSVDPQIPSNVPSWMTWTDNGDGSATLTGTPPLSLLGTTNPSSLVFEINYLIGGQGFGNGGFASIEIDVAPLTFTKDAPPNTLDVDAPYSYGFAATDPNATFAVASGDTLPDGLTLSSSGTLSGTPSTVGSWQFSVVATNANGSFESEPIVLTVKSAVHQLEISAFRLYGPAGAGDWFVSAQNTTSAPIQLYGWQVGIFVPGLTSPLFVSLPVETLATGATVTVAGPYFSMSPLISVDAIGPSSVANPGGFEIISPDGTLIDSAGQVGAPSGAVAGTGLAIPTGTDITAQSAYVRDFASGALVDTNNNAADFTYRNIQLAQSPLIFTSSATNTFVGDTYSPTATGGSSGNAVTFAIDPSSTPGTCDIVSSVVEFLGAGTCIVDASMTGGTQYLNVSASQSILVTVAMKIPFAPNDILATVEGTSSAEVSWTASAGATSYKVTTNGLGTCTWSIGTTATCTALTANTPYTFSVFATNLSGTSAPGFSSPVTTAPSAPSGVVGTATGSTTAIVTWIASAGATGYEVNLSGGGGTCIWSSGLEAFCSALAPDVTYTFNVQAKGTSNVYGDYSVASAPVTTLPPSATPALVPVTKKVTPKKSVTVTIGSGSLSATVYVPIGAVTTNANVLVSPISTVTSKGIVFADGTLALNLSITSSSGKPITSFAVPVDLSFPDAPADFVPAYSHNGTTWTEIPVIADPPTLPTGWPDGWYRDSSGTVHILTRHATYYAELTNNNGITQALQLTVSVSRTLNIVSTRVITLHLNSSFPSVATIELSRGSRRIAAWREHVSATSLLYVLQLPRSGLQKGSATLTFIEHSVGESVTKSLTLNFV